MLSANPRSAAPAPDTTAPAPDTTAPAPDTTAPAPEIAGATPFAAGELLVAFAPALEASLPADLARLVGAELVESYPRSGIHRVRIRDGDVRAAARRLRASGLVRFAEPNYRFRLAGLIPNDPGYADQAGYWDLVGAPDAWEFTTGSRSVVVAMLDGAVDLDHPDLAANIWTNPGEIPDNGIDDDGNGFVDDLHGYDFVGAFPGSGGGRLGEDGDPDAKPGDPALGDGLDQDGDGKVDGAVGHGTLVAGILAAVGNNGLGAAGAAWQLSVMPLRITDPEGNGFFSSFVRGLEYAVANDADIVNISLASPFLPESARLAVETALDAGLIIVVAAGNGGLNVDFPAAIPGVVAVGTHGALDDPDARALFSPRNAGVDFVAPGIDVYSTDVAPLTGAPTYGVGTGTSFSAPFVTGAIALILATSPTATPADVLALLQEGAVDLPDADAPNWDGAGRVHLGRTLAALLARPPAAPIIDGVDVTDARIIVSGRAVPGSAVRISDGGAEEPPFGVVTAAPDGTFALELARRALPETVAVLSLVAVAETSAGPSPPSTPLPFALPRTVPLQPGWNLVAWAGVTGPGHEALAALPPRVTRVFAWDGAHWEIGVPASPVLTISQIHTGQGLWLFVEGAAPVEWQQTRAEFAAVALAPGWRLVAWAGARTDVAGAVAATDADIRAVFAWDAAAGRFRSFRAALPLAPGGPPGTLSRLGHLDAVWVVVGERGGNWPALEPAAP